MIGKNLERKIWLSNKWKLDALHEEQYITIHCKDEVFNGLKLLFIEANQVDHPYEQIFMHALGFCRESRKKSR